MDAHFEGAEERSRAAAEFLEPLGWDLYGTPSPAAVTSLREAADSAGVPLRVHAEFVSGFLRLGGGGHSGSN